MGRKANDSNSLQIVREAVEALMRCDDARMEELARICEGWLRDLPPCMESQSFNSANVGSAEFERLARLLEVTKENLRIIRLPRPASIEPLEYIPSAGYRGCGAGD